MRPPSPEQHLSDAILFVNPSDEDYSSFRNAVPAEWRLYHATTRAEALRFFDRHRLPVIVVEQTLPDGYWQDVLEGIYASVESPPHIIVSSRLADDHLWAEVLNLGGYDLLTEPFKREEVERIINSAMSLDQYQRVRSAAIAAIRSKIA